MNPTRLGEIPSEVKRLFFNELMPLAKRFREEGRRFFPIHHDPNVRTYYERRKNTSMATEDVELMGCDCPDRLKDALADLWISQGYPELAALAPKISELAESLCDPEEQDEEVSPFIYVMF